MLEFGKASLTLGGINDSNKAMKSKNALRAYVFGNHFQTLNSSLTNEKISSRPVAPRLFPHHHRLDEPHHLPVDYFSPEDFGGHPWLSIDAGLLSLFVIPSEESEEMSRKRFRQILRSAQNDRFFMQSPSRGSKFRAGRTPV